MSIRLLDRVVSLRRGEGTTATLLFAYSFLAMTAYNIIKPLTKSRFITGFGADNLPYVLLVASVLIGVLMQAYSLIGARMSRRALIPTSLAGMVGIVIAFWLLFKTGAAWVPVAFYIFGLILGVLLISQFWTVANDVYDSRQARRLFGFIGGGASLGGAMGNGITWWLASEVGTDSLLLVCAGVLLLCLGIVLAVSKYQPAQATDGPAFDERGVGGGEAIRLLGSSRHLQTIALVIACAAIGAIIAEQQLNMAAEASKNSEGDLAGFFGQIGFYLSMAAFVVQVGLTSRIHRSLGLTFALLLLPLGLAGAGVMILLSQSLWAPSLAKALDSSLRYSLDKTTREVLFLPLPADLKHRAKPFVDVTMDRFAKALGGLLVLVLIKPWGLGLDWPRLSYATLVVMALWVVLALVARHEYLQSFRRSLDARDMEPADVRVAVADPATVETLVRELSNPDEAAVVYAIDMLETLDKRHLITPLLLHHESAKVRARALAALGAAAGRHAQAWLPAVDRMLKDPDADVRAAALAALTALSGEDASSLVHRFLDDGDPRVAVTAAAALADSGRDEDARAADATLTRLISDTRDAAADGRREAASALARISNPAFRTLLVPLIHDPNVEVAREAVAGARASGASDPIFVPALVSLLGHRMLKSAARDALVSYGPDIIALLAHVLTDPHEQVWSRRHVPATLARIPTQQSMDALVAALDQSDGFLRFKIVEAIGTLRQGHPELTFSRAAIEALIVRDTARYYMYLTLRFNLVSRDAAVADSLLVRALDDKLGRTLDRVYRELGLLYPWKDVAAARRSIEGVDPRRRAGAIEYLDNLFSGAIRKRVMPILEDMPVADKVHIANTALKTRPRDLEETLTQLVHDDDPVVAASAIDLVEQRQIESLAGDLSFIVDRGTADPLVLEAAIFARAGRAARAVPGAVGGSQGPLPVVRLASRLRTLPLFGFVSIDELFRIASAAQQVRYDRGRNLAVRGTPADEVYFLLDGAVRVSAPGAPTADVPAPAALAFDDMLVGRPIRVTITAIEPVVSLTLSGADFMTMLSDNIAMAQGVFRLLLDAPEARARAEATGTGRGVPPRPHLDAAEKALLLRQHPILAGATVEQLLDLAAVTRTVPLAAGSELAGDREEPATYWVLEGQVQVGANGAARVELGPGGVFGLSETLSGVPSPHRVVVSKGGQALRLAHDDLFDVLGDHIDLLQGVFGGVLGVSDSPRSHRVSG